MSESNARPDEGQELEMGPAFEGIVDRLDRINDVVARLDDAIKAQAFEVLRPFIGMPPSTDRSAERDRSPAKPDGRVQASQPEGLGDFIAKQLR
jgi:hypothetical protein